MKRLLSFAYLWILALPLFFTFLGAASNQAVIAANHDRFPVMVNERKLKTIEKRETDEDNVLADIGGLIGIKLTPPPPPDDGMIDDVHCVMTPETHLNFLADWIDLNDAIYSPGDLLLYLGSYLQPISFPIWFAIILCEFRRRQIRD